METRQNSASQTDTDGFIVYLKSEDIYADLERDVGKYLIHQTMKSRNH